MDGQVEDMSDIKHDKFFYREITLILFVCVFAAITGPVKTYAAPLVYQCVGKNVYAETTGCTQTQFIPGSTALRMLTFALRDFDKAKTAGDVSEQTKQTSEIVKQLTILEYPIGADPIVAARSLLNVDVPKQEEAAVKGLVCDGVLTNLFNPICWARTIAAVASSLLISVAAWALAIAGVLFNWAIMNSVILFKDVIFEPIKDGINIGWTAFRDISNIVIIGVFAFIAISIILGNKTFGDKKLVARVLVIAILINFSLLFTKMIIDASNFTAGQFYAATQEGGGKTLSQIIDENKPGQGASASKGTDFFSGGFAQSGIAGQFVNFLGVTGVADTYSSLKNVGDKNDSGWVMLVHAIFAMLLLLGAAIVLFYGSFLLISRAVILIFLLLTSAIAFASHLIPKMSDGQFGWSAWWKSLLGSAVLAPLLMIFLYITLQIASNLQAKSGTLGSLISQDADGGDINALFAYLIVLGLLFGSFKLASSFSSKIGGFNFASMIPAIGVGLAARAAGFGARMVVGGGSTIIGERFAKSAKTAMGEGKTVRAGLLDMTAQRFKGVGKRDFNVANTFLGKEIAGMAGLKGALSGQTKTGGFEGYEKRRREGYAARTERTAYTQPELEKKMEEASASAATEMGKIAEEKRAVREDALKLQNYVSVETEKKNAIEKDIKKINAEKPTNIEAAKARNAALADRQSMLSAQDQRIKAAARLMSTYETKSADLDKQEVALKERRNEDIEKALPKGSTERDASGNVKLKPFRERLGDAATEIAHKRLTNLPFVYAGQTVENDRVAKQMRKEVGDRETNKYLKRMLTLAEETRTQEEREHREVLRQGRATQRIIREAGDDSNTPPSAAAPKHS